MSYLDYFPTFKRVVELGSFTVAGNHLRIRPTVVAQRIRKLEQHFGIRLFNRTTRRLVLTKQGEAIYHGIVDVMNRVSDLENKVYDMSAKPSGLLRVTAPLGIGRRLIAPAVPEFHERYPDIEIRLRLADHRVDLLKEGMDLAFRLGVVGDSSFIMRKVLNCERVLAASPSYLDNRGRPEHPEQLCDHDCLLLRYAGATEYEWPITTEQGTKRIKVAGPIDSDHGDVLTGWAVDGRGITLKLQSEIQPILDAGQLEIVMPNHPPASVPLVVLFPHRTHQDPKVRCFADFMIKRCRAALAA